MIKIVIDHQVLDRFKARLLKKLIARRAYKGYTSWVKDGDEKPLSYDEFKEFEFWKIELSFRIYFNKFKKGPFMRSYLNFKGVVLNTYGND